MKKKFKILLYFFAVLSTHINLANFSIKETFSDNRALLNASRNYDDIPLLGNQERSFMCQYNLEDKIIIAESIKIITQPDNNQCELFLPNDIDTLFSRGHTEPVKIFREEGKFDFITLAQKIDFFEIQYKEYDIINKSEIFKTAKVFLENESSKINFDQPNNSLINEPEIPLKEISTYENSNMDEKNKDCCIQNDKQQSPSSLSNLLLQVLQSSNNIFILFFLAFVIGILMSFTPCIYPMIPVTLGILSNNSSQKQRIARSTAYVLGIGCTFAILGLLAASGKMVFGSLLGSKWFTISLCCMLIYLAGSMLGFYEMHVPQFYGNYFAGESLISAFLYGAFSGTITSPCVSPGLLTLLTVIAENGNYFIGFFMLFFFGIGMGAPLWISSVALNSFSLPKAGMWMIEVKRFLGILILCVAGHYAQAFLNNLTLFALGAIFSIILIIHIINSIKDYESEGLRWYKRILIIAAWTACFLCVHKAYKAYNATVSTYLFKTLKEARQHAIQEKKLLLIDFTAKWCSSCKELEALCIENQDFWKNMSSLLTGVSIDCTDMDNAEIKDLLKKYNVNGLPTIILMDAEKDFILGIFGGELTEKNTAEIMNIFLKKIEAYKSKELFTQRKKNDSDSNICTAK